MSKYTITKQQQANLIEALHVMWPSVPPENVMSNLGSWREPSVKDCRSPINCGTHACFGGFVAHYPKFYEQGARVCPWSGAPFMASDTVMRDAAFAAQTLFGDKELFSARDAGHPADKRFTGTDHALVSHRLQYVLKHAEVV